MTTRTHWPADADADAGARRCSGWSSRHSPMRRTVALPLSTAFTASHTMSCDAAAAAPAAAASATPAAAAAVAAAAPSSNGAAAGGGAVWEDITARLHSALTSGMLRPGQLLHHPSFSLKESMSALEIGDPKMDSAMHVPRNTMSVDKMLAAGTLLPGGSLTPFHELEIMDELLACEVTMYSGSSAAHSLFTCGYLHRLRLVWESCPRLGAFLALTLKSVELVRSVIIAADIHAEEDFYYNMHDIRLGAMSIAQNFRNGHSTATAAASRASTGTGSGSVTAAEEEAPEALYGGLTVEQLLQHFDVQHALLESRVAELSAADAASAKPTPEAALSGPASPDSSELHVCTLMLQRFEFRRSWYQLHLLLRRPPFNLRANLGAVRPHELAIGRALQGMLRSVRGSSEREEEALRMETERAYEKEVTALLASHAAAVALDPLAAPPAFPKKPSPNLPARALSFGFDARLTACLVQNAPPRTLSILHRRDALGVLVDLMAHLGFWHALPAIAVQPGAGAIELLQWFEAWARLDPSVILRSHLWLYMQWGATQGDDTKDPSIDLFAFLQEGASPPPPLVIHSASATGNKHAHTPMPPAPFEGHYSTREMVIRSHVSHCGSIERLAVEALVAEGAQRRSSVPPPFLDPATAPMTYSFFLQRLTVPLYNYAKILLEHSALYRRKILHPDSAFVLDWNILMADARHVDAAFAHRFLAAEDAVVALPAGMHPQARGSHPQLYYHHNVYSLVLDRLVQFQASHVLSGLESGLYGAKEAQVVLWYLEHLLGLQVGNRNMSYRNRAELLALKKNAPPAASGSEAAKKKAAASFKKLALSALPPSAPQAPYSVHFALVEAQQYVCRGIIQLMEGARRLRFRGPLQQLEAVAVPSVNPEMAETWFAHRFADLHMVHTPPPLHYGEFCSTMSQFDAPPASAATPEGQAKHADAIIAMAARSLAFAKEILSGANQHLATQAAAAAAASSSAGPPIGAIYADQVKSLLRVTVTNSLLTLTYKKAMAQAEAAGKRLRLALRWEAHGGTAYTPLHSARMVPFPILQLVQCK